MRQQSVFLQVLYRIRYCLFYYGCGGCEGFKILIGISFCSSMIPFRFSILFHLSELLVPDHVQGRHNIRLLDCRAVEDEMMSPQRLLVVRVLSFEVKFRWFSTCKISCVKNGNAMLTTVLFCAITKPLN